MREAGASLVAPTTLTQLTDKVDLRASIEPEASLTVVRATNLSLRATKLSQIDDYRLEASYMEESKDKIAEP